MASCPWLEGFRDRETDIYKPVVVPLRPDALELFAIGERMMLGVRELIVMLSEPKLELTRVRDRARPVDDAEAEADRLVAAAERRLVAEYMPPGANRLEFIAWDKLYQLLEQMTDEANHCAKLVLSLARKEA